MEKEIKYRKTIWYYLTRLFKSSWLTWQLRYKPFYINRKENRQLTIDNMILLDVLWLPIKIRKDRP